MAYLTIYFEHDHNIPMSNFNGTHTYKVYGATGGVSFRGTEREINRLYGTEIWDWFAEAVDHDDYCECLVHIAVEIGPDPWGNPVDIVAPF
jgi:hypothetical protein